MKSGLSIVILVVAIFMGFLMGYSLPPMFEVGLIGGGADREIGLKKDVNHEMEQYYKELSKEAE